jgi:sec-independent protein translocase protein TatA
MFGISTTELLILAGVLLLLFGASRLPSLMRNMGRSVNEFKQGLRDKPAEIKSLEEKEEVS